MFANDSVTVRALRTSSFLTLPLPAPYIHLAPNVLLGSLPVDLFFLMAKTMLAKASLQSTKGNKIVSAPDIKLASSR